MMLNYRLMTEYGERLRQSDVLPEYPRPQLRRESYINLCGKWRYSTGKCDAPSSCGGEITVPFPPESCLSGVGIAPKTGEYMFYEREFTVPDSFLRDITLFHIDAADQICDLWINGEHIGSHDGGYLPAVFDVSGSIKPGVNTARVRVLDRLDFTYPTGKQRKKRGGIWYTPISGIWQAVWLESVTSGYVKSLRITPDIDEGCVHIEIESDAKELSVEIVKEGEVICRQSGSSSRFVLPVPDAHLWSPDDPFLYTLTVTADGDRVSSYFAMRKFATKDGRFYLNGKPYFINGLLDQGYFSDGIYTPASYDSYRDDILRMKALGFNTLRKHIKIEPMMFYYLCDTLGMLVFQDMVNVGKYSFFKDSVLPITGLCKRLPYKNIGRAGRECFTSHAIATVNYLFSCPCVVYYTIFNEGWGQFDGDGLYRILKGIDPTRVFDSTSGWFRETLSDVVSEHIYFRPVKLKREDARPVILSEFGGYSHSVKGHVFNDKKEFGYRKFASATDLENAFVALYENEIIPAAERGELAGAIYTQLSDVEDETNGILTYDRRVMKLSVERILPLMKRLCNSANQEKD